ncbi:MAG: tyrosine phosphatase family protein, partial [Gemmatimonadaceae bacterium]
RVISLLDPEFAFPELGPQYGDRHLRLSFHDIHVPADNYVVPSAEHVGDLLRFLMTWDRRDPLLIHCRAGISRSTATGFIAACFANPESDEREIAAALRRASALARPNLRLVRLADREMERSGRMSAAISVTFRNLPWIDVEEGEPFQMLSTYERRNHAN